MPKSVEGLSPQEAYSYARGYALDRLAERARSRGELRDALMKRSVPDDVVAAVLDRLEAAGFINDLEFARSWVSSRQQTRGLARRALASELRHKGVADDITVTVLDEIDPQLECESAHRLVQRKLPSIRNLDQATQIRRLTSMLARKGYPNQVAFEVVRAEIEHCHDYPLEST